MAFQTLMLVGGVNNDDYKWLLSHEGKSSTWSCPKKARVGDRAFIYIAAPIGQVVAMAKVISEPQPGSELNSSWRYVAVVGPIELLASPIPLAELHALCPKWPWLRYPRSLAYVPAVEAKVLAQRAVKIIPPAQLIKNQSGAGFGDPETNRQVEVASVRVVTKRFRLAGFTIKSREKECLGYDLDATKGRRTLHVEVKGVTGSVRSFPITAGEVNYAKRDRSFRLAVVTNALTPAERRIKVFTAAEFLRDFQLRELSYFAIPRSR